MCRFCTITKNEFLHNCLSERPLRTPQNYNCAVQDVDHQNCCMGIKQSSIFNELKFFHVCDPGLPSCIGHDVFEGVVQYDMILYVKYFVKNHWFTFEYLNSALDNFMYSQRENCCKPPTLVATAKRLTGNASQNWTFLRFFPLYVFNKIKNVDDVVWKLVLMLRCIVELITAPCLSCNDVIHLHYLVKKYLESRCSVFSDVLLRPKHHYLMHYAWLILQYGPIHHCSTLRFESKHSYFKRLIRAKTNFKNVCSTLAYNHQYLLACLLRKGLFCQDLQYTKSCVCSARITEFLVRNGFIIHQCTFAKSTLFKGVSYTTNCYVVLNKLSNDLLLGKVVALFHALNCPYLVVETEVSRFFHDYGMFALETNADITNNLKCICINDLIKDFYPLYSYSLRTSKAIVLKHFTASQ